MPCFSLAQSKNSCFRFNFLRAGLRSSLTHLHDGATTLHCWLPKLLNPSKPSLLHGLVVNATWQFTDLIHHVTPHYNVYVPDILFFGDPPPPSPTAPRVFRRVMESHSVKAFSLVGLSYGGFVGYRLAAQYKEAVERVVICCAAVCMEERLAGS